MPQIFSFTLSHPVIAAQRSNSRHGFFWALKSMLLLSFLSACSAAPFERFYSQGTLDIKPKTEDLQRIKTQLATPEWQMSSTQLPWLQPLINDESARLLGTALTHNEDVLQSQLAAAVAGFNYRQIKTDQEPDLDLSISGQRADTPDTSPESQLNLGLDLRWDADIWGVLRLRSKQAYLQWLSSASLYQQQKNQLFLDVLTEYLNIMLLGERLNIFERRHDTLEAQALTIEDNYLNGVTQARDVLQARSDLQNIEAQIIATQSDLQISKKRLLRLLGRDDMSQLAELTLGWVSLGDVQDLPLDWQLNDLIVAPPVQQEWLTLLETDAELAIAHRQRFPQLVLSASGDYRNDSVSQWLQRDKLFWSLVAQLTQPILDQKRLAQEVEKQALRLEQQELAYNQSVRSALSQMHQLFIAESHLQERYLTNRAELDTRLLSESLALEEYLLGIIDYDSLLESQRTVLDIRTTLVDIIGEIYRNRLQIAVLLGGENQPAFYSEPVPQTTIKETEQPDTTKQNSNSMRPRDALHSTGHHSS